MKNTTTDKIVDLHGQTKTVTINGKEIILKKLALG